MPYGYRRNGTGLTPHEDEATLVRRIFELAARGETKSAIAKALEAEGLVRRNGKVWTRRQVSAVLTRAELYQGGFVRYGEASGQDTDLALVRQQRESSDASARDPAAD
ncbi:MAG: recombinase family protein [Candidatus Rokubacteria bacterium]|nr:recombinase family protein [Candidatus Rokubacteria bacterium]